jgi:hypothetical protein
MRRGSMRPPRLESLDEAGEPLNDGADGDLGGSFLPHPPPPPPPAPQPTPGDDAAAVGGNGRRSGLCGAPAKEQHHPRAAPPLVPLLRRPWFRGKFDIALPREIWSLELSWPPLRRYG